MLVWLWVAVSFLAGALVGGTTMVLVRRGRDVEKRIRRLQREYDLYQADVARHFTQTGELLSRLRGAFDQLYGEVEDRATELVGEESLQRRLRGVEGTATPEPSDRSHPVGDDRPGAPGAGPGVDPAPPGHDASSAGTARPDDEHVGDGPERP